MAPFLWLLDRPEGDGIGGNHYDAMVRHGADPAVLVVGGDAEDTDVLVIAAYVSTKVPGLLAVKRKKGIFPGE